MMADEKGQATQEPQNAPDTGQPANTATPPENKSDNVTMSSAELQSKLDRAAQSAVKAHLDKESKKRIVADEAAELKKAEDRGEYDKVIASHKADNDALLRRFTRERAFNSLKVEALKGEAQIADPDDLRLLTADIIDGCLAESGEVNAEAVTKTIATLRETKPHLFRVAADDKRYKGAPSTGSGLPAPSLNAWEVSQDQWIADESAKRKALRTPPRTNAALQAIKNLLAKG